MPKTEQEGEIETLRKDLKEALELRDRMVNLVGFAGHREHCATRTIREAACNCGYLDALRGESESDDQLARMMRAVDREPPPEPMSESEIRGQSDPAFRAAFKASMDSANKCIRRVTEETGDEQRNTCGL